MNVLIISLIVLVLSCASAEDGVKDITNIASRSTDSKDSAKRDYNYNYEGSRKDQLNEKILTGYRGNGEATFGNKEYYYYVPYNAYEE